MREIRTSGLTRGRVLPSLLYLILSDNFFSVSEKGSSLLLTFKGTHLLYETVEFLE